MRLKSMVARGCYAIYSCVLFLMLPFILLRLWLKGRGEPMYRARWGERLGIYCVGVEPVDLWIHAASVGEWISIIPLIKQLPANYRLLATCVTPTGSALIEKRLGARVHHVYMPFDHPLFIRSLLRRFKPKLLLLVETELWPNMLRQSHQHGLSLAMINARISDRSFPRYARFSYLFKPLLALFDYCAAQSDLDANRCQQLGVRPCALQVMKNLKWIKQLPVNWIQVAHARRQAWTNADFLWVAGSTHAPEEKQMIEVHIKLLEQYPNARLILAPRHPSRAQEVEGYLKASGLSYVRSSDVGCKVKDTQVLLVNDIGRLLDCYAMADAAFVGGSLTALGGHNLLEPASVSTAVMVGPHWHNFKAIGAQLIACKALCEVCDEQALLDTLVALCSDPDFCLQMQARAQHAFPDAQDLLSPLLQWINATIEDKSLNDKQVRSPGGKQSVSSNG